MTFLVVSCFLDWSHSSKFCVAVFTVVVTGTSFGLTWLPLREKCPLSSLGQQEILRLSQTFYGFTCSTLLGLSCARIFKLVCLLLIFKHIRPNVYNFPFAFPRMAAMLKWSFPDLQIWVMLSSRLPKFTLTTTVRSTNRKLDIGMGGYGWGTQVLGVSMGQLEGSVCKASPLVPGWGSWWHEEWNDTVSRIHNLLFWASCLPLSQPPPASCPQPCR